MLKQWKGFLSGVIFTLVLMVLTGTVFVAVTGISIIAHYQKIKILLKGDNVRIILDGQEITSTDTYGNIVDSFILNGSTYVPIRVVSRAFNKFVEWDADAKQVVMETEIGEFWQNFVRVPEQYKVLIYIGDIWMMK